MALYLLQLGTRGGTSRVDGIKARVVEADSEATAKRIATAQEHGDSDWTNATASAISAGVASDYEGFTYSVKVSGDPGVAGSKDLFDVAYTGVGSDTVDLIGEALANSLRGEAVAACIQDDASSYTDLTTEANESTADDVVFPAAPADGDAILIGMSRPFTRALVNVTTAGVGTYTITWKYWDGDSWEALTGVTDDTTNLQTAGMNDVVFTQPSDWAASTINSQGPFYYIAAVIDAGTHTTDPLIGQIWAREGLRASYDGGTNTLTVAAVADGIGDHSLEVSAKLPDAPDGLSDLVGTVTDGGAAAAALTVVFEDETAIPAIMTSI
ncbi:MAG: hypothetical protein ACYTDW_09680 [Planctomycetota bacterium]|jgi:hypothetical protein